MKRHISLLLLLALCGAAMAQNMRSEFLTPPQQARPRVWWHWMNGNISRDGLRKDLLWMHRAGIGGVHIFDAGMETPQVVPERVTYMSPAWQDCYRSAVALCDSLGMEATMTATPGWSHSGGPWVRPEDAMKKLVWRDTVVCIGKREEGRGLSLLPPYTVSGDWQNLPATGTASDKQYYQDIAWVAVRMADDDLTMQEMGAQLSSPAPGTVVCALDKPRTVRALSIYDGRQHSQWRNKRPAPVRWLEASDDAQTWRKVCDVMIGGTPLFTMNIPATTARYWRMVWQAGKEPAADVQLTLHTVARVDHAEEKAGFGSPVDLSDYPTQAGAQAVPTCQVIVSSSSLFPLPSSLTAGRWRVYRFGYSLTGKENHPASPEATGLEVDKLDKDAVARYFAQYLPMYEKMLGPLMGKRGVQNLLQDNYEAGIANWTPRLPEEFQKRCGYELMPWLPALAGIVVGSAEQTDRFLYDYRQTLAALVETNYYDQLAAETRRRGMGTYFQSHESCRPLIADGMNIKRRCTVPMGVMWASYPTLYTRGGEETGKQGDIRETASVAHIYGQNLVAAESMTSNGLDLDGLAYSLTPEMLKPVADLEFACGLNRIVIHESAHQPDDTHLPGQGLRIYGQWFHRHETWAEQARPWMDYLARTSYMLQQGRFVADVAYYYGDDNNVTGLFYDHQPAVPATHNYDYASTAVVNEELGVTGSYEGVNRSYEDNTSSLFPLPSSLTTKSGMSYRLLALDGNTARMTVATLRSLARMVDAGVPVCGKRPTVCPSLADDPAEWQRLVTHIWDGGHKNVFDRHTVAEALEAIGCRPDLQTDDMDSLRFVHRRTAAADIYWIVNRSHHARRQWVTFRVSGRVPALWHPETGKVSPVDYEQTAQGTRVDLTLLPAEAYFIVFEDKDERSNEGDTKELRGSYKDNGKSSDTATSTILTPHSSLHTPHSSLLPLPSWTVSFQSAAGPSPADTVMTALSPLTDSPVAGIRYFAGVATYTTHVRLTGKQAKSRRVTLSLGDVTAIAEVRVNGQTVATLWKHPYEADITQAVSRGENRIEVRVTTLWRNRLIGDQQPGAKRVTYTSYPFYKADAPLHPMGLMGPAAISYE